MATVFHTGLAAARLDLYVEDLRDALLRVAWIGAKPIHTASATGAGVSVTGAIKGQVGVALGKYSLGMSAAIVNEDPVKRMRSSVAGAFG